MVGAALNSSNPHSTISHLKLSVKGSQNPRVHCKKKKKPKERKKETSFYLIHHLPVASRRAGLLTLGLWKIFSSVDFLIDGSLILQS